MFAHAQLASGSAGPDLTRVGACIACEHLFRGRYAPSCLSRGSRPVKPGVPSLACPESRPRPWPRTVPCLRGQLKPPRTRITGNSCSTYIKDASRCGSLRASRPHKPIRGARAPCRLCPRDALLKHLLPLDARLHQGLHPRSAMQLL